jgi:hypothetical protein
VSGECSLFARTGLLESTQSRRPAAARVDSIPWQTSSFERMSRVDLKRTLLVRQLRQG